MDVASVGERMLYLYGVVPRAQGVPNGADAAVQAVSHSGIVALVEAVCAREFSSDALDDKLKSVEWVARLAHKHEAVLECAMRQGPVVPARLCTLFNNTESLRLSLAENEARFLAALDRVRAREEWGIKVYRDDSRLRAVVGLDDAQVLALDAAVAKASPGQAFILRKKRDARLAEAALARTDAMADEALETLESDAADLRLRPLLSEEASGRPEPMVLNVAALVDITAREVLRTTLSRLSEHFEAEGFSFEASGPWPPYSFCDGEGRDTVESDVEFGEGVA